MAANGRLETATSLELESNATTVRCSAACAQIRPRIEVRCEYRSGSDARELETALSRLNRL
jgi:hypothetical protein